MGSPCALHLYDEDGIRAEDAAEAAIAEVARLEQKYSRYRDDNVTAAINASSGDPDGVEVDRETSALLDYAATCFEQSGGLFDPTSGVYRQVWDFKSGRVPTRRDLDAVRARVGFEKLRWERPRLVLPIPGMEIDFGGFVKEYAADRAAELCRRNGLRSGLVDLGGDVCVVGPHPDGKPWTVGIRHPRRPGEAVSTVSLVAGGIASSGDYERFMIVDGTRYAHLLHPKTGWPVTGLAGVSVAAPLCLVAGSASTIAMLKGSEGAAWLAALGLPSLCVDSSGALGGSLCPAQRGPRPSE